jgi:hypothetical protein
MISLGLLVPYWQKFKQTIQSLSVYDKEHLCLNFLTKIFQKSSSITHLMISRGLLVPYWHQILGLSPRYWVDVPINLREYEFYKYGWLMRISEIFLLENLSIKHAYIWHLRIRASSLQFRANKINMALALMDNLFKKLMSNPELHYYTAPNRFCGRKVLPTN